MIAKLPDRIFLTGFMGAGKSIIGRQLAGRLELPFLDLDDKIIQKAGRSIPEIFDELGEPEFRSIEKEAVLEITRKFKGVVALGGGSLQNQHLVDHIKLSGLLIFIETPVSVILDRIMENKDRPLLLDENGNQKDEETLRRQMKTLYEERLPFYEQAVIRIINDGSKSPEQVVEKLLKKIKNHVEYY